MTPLKSQQWEALSAAVIKSVALSLHQLTVAVVFDLWKNVFLVLVHRLVIKGGGFLCSSNKMLEGSYWFILHSSIGLVQKWINYSSFILLLLHLPFTLAILAWYRYWPTLPMTSSFSKLAGHTRIDVIEHEFYDSFLCNISFSRTEDRWEKSLRLSSTAKE